ncbi:MAG: hypothetical protein R3323_08210 [Wenzhouxiangellaceae bacterium]|nr:hypothetical protein [Wenzhouxiangellaceae bacterium]
MDRSLPALRAALVVGSLIAVPAWALEWTLEAGATRVGPLEFDEASARRRADGSVAVAVEGATARPGIALGGLRLRCPADPRRRCAGGSLEWDRPAAGTVSGTVRADDAGLRVTLGDARLLRAPSDNAVEWTLEGVPLEWVPPGVRDRFGLAALSGSFAGDLRFEGMRLRASVAVRSLEFDTVDGRYAGAGLGLSAEAQWSDGDVETTLRWTDGEALLGPVYLPPPPATATISVAGDRENESGSGNGGWRIRSLVLDLPGVVRAEGSALLPAPLGPPVTATLELAHLDLAAGWEQGLQSLAARSGLGDLSPSGRLSGRAAWDRGRITNLGLRIESASLADAKSRLSLDGIAGAVDFDGAERDLSAALEWSEGMFYRIPLGAVSARVTGRSGEPLRLAAPIRVPVLDGALTVDRFSWEGWLAGEAAVQFDAGLEPIDLRLLTRTLGWPEFGGQVSGEFPGLELAGSVFRVDGVLDVAMFSGRARVENLSIERPFGTLPALAADLRLERLDLEPLTGAFSFGRMTGRLSGHVTGLRLLDWQPVAFDAWLATEEDVDGPRRISQRAVDSLSSIGGGPSGLSSTFLRFFDDFPYEQVGLGCRLANNVCRMRGLETLAGGGYLIVEGRSLPRLDVVGYRRNVDWPRLLAQLRAATRGEGGITVGQRAPD